MTKDVKRPLLPRIASYSAQDGRAACSSMEQQERYGADGENWTVWKPEARGVVSGNSPTWDEIDKSRCQSPVAVRDRKLG